MDNGHDVHLILTGGEPLLAWQRLYVELFEHPYEGFEECNNQHYTKSRDDFYNYQWS